jgi:hypothetical protein
MPFDGAGFGRMLIVEKIDKVSELLAREDRWCKGMLRSSDGRRCIAGAVIEVEARKLLTPVLVQAIRETSGGRYRRIEVFNDAPSTTHAQVLAVLRRARENVLLGPPERISGPGRLMATWRRWTTLARRARGTILSNSER